MNRLIFFALYFSEGAPIGFIWWAMPAILSKQGFDITQVATISALAAIPWSLKFLFAPVIDLLSMHFIRLKKQLMIYQIAMGLSIYFVVDAIESKDPRYLIIIILIHGFFSSLQDICIDALAIKNIPEEEIGRINGIMQAGMLIGRSLFGGAGVFLAHKLGLNILIYFLISSIWVSLILLSRSNFNHSPNKKVTIRQYGRDFYNIVTKKFFWILIALTYFTGFSYNGISTIGSAMLSKFDASALTHGMTYGIFLPLSMSLGALLGGYLSDKSNGLNYLQYNLILSILTSLIVGLGFDFIFPIPILVIAYIIFYFFIGATTSSLYGFLMKNTSKEFAALEFSIFMGVVNLCDSSSSYLTGQLIKQFNYTLSTLIVALICLASFMPIQFFKKTDSNK